MDRRAARRRSPRSAVRRAHLDERGQSLAIVLTLITFLFLVGSAMATHASVALRATAANEAQAGDLHAADAGAELGMWWQRNGMAGNPPPISVNGLTVTTTVGVSGGTPCPTRTPIRLTGFESGAVSTSGGGLFSAITGSGAVSDASVVRSGARSLRITDPFGSATRVTIPSAGTSVIARLYLRLASLPAADVAELLVLDAAAGNDLRLGYQAATQRLTLRFGAAAVTVAGSAISAATWVRLDLRLTANANPRTADWRVDGAVQTALSSAGSASTVTAIRLGSTVGADTYTANYDDLMTSATIGDYPIGDGAVLPLRPDGMGSHSTPGSFHHEDGSAIGATTYQRLDDDPMTSVTDYARQDVVGGTSHLELTFSNTSATCIVGVAGVVGYHSASAAANAARTSIVDGATERILFSGDMSEVSLFYRSAIMAPTGTWTTAKVNGLVGRIGYATDVSPNPYWDALLLEVATGSGAPSTVTVTASAGASTVTATYQDAGTSPPVLLSWATSR